MKFEGLVSKKNKKLRNKISNWKFKSAVAYLDGEKEKVKEIVKSLAELDKNNDPSIKGLIHKTIRPLIEYLIGEFKIKE